MIDTEHCVYCAQTVYPLNPHMVFSTGQVSHLGCALHPAVKLP